MSEQRVAIFPDTNLLLHFRAINEIDWRGLLNASLVEIKVAPVVPHELEEQRVVHQVRKIRDRATTSLKLLQSYLRQNLVREGVTLEFLTSEPTPDYAAARMLNLTLADDRFIGALLLFREMHPDVHCIVVTNDLPLTIRLTQRQIEFISLDDSLRLATDPDPLEKRNKQLEAELQRYKSREPDLSIKFVTGQNFARFQLAIPTNTQDTEPQIQAKLVAAKEKCKPVELAPEPEPINPNHPFAAIAEQIRLATEGLQLVGRQFYEDYNRRVEKYYRDYEKLLRDTADFKTLATRTIKLEMILDNSGTSPAEDIDVHLHFPDGFLLYDERRPPKPPEEPSIPSKDMNLFPSMSLLPNIPYIPKMPTLPNPTIPRIRKTNSYNVDFELPKLKHGYIWRIDPFCVAFDSWLSATSFAIDYTVHAGNMIDEQTGQLGVIIEKT